MTKVVIARVGRRPRRQKASSVAKRLVRGENGRRAAVYTLDSTRKSFDSDLISAFEANVAAARAANAAIFGSPDGPGES